MATAFAVDRAEFIRGYQFAIERIPIAPGVRWQDRLAAGLAPMRSGEAAALEADCAELLRQHGDVFQDLGEHPELAHWGHFELGAVAWWGRQDELTDEVAVELELDWDDPVRLRFLEAMAAYGPHRNGPYEADGALAYGTPQFQIWAAYTAAMRACTRRPLKSVVSARP